MGKGIKLYADGGLIGEAQGFCADFEITHVVPDENMKYVDLNNDIQRFGMSIEFKIKQTNQIHWFFFINFELPRLCNEAYLRSIDNNVCKNYTEEWFLKHAFNVLH